MTLESSKHSGPLERFLGQGASSALELELLHFWRRHQNTRFSQSAILYAMDSRKLDTQQALDSLVARGLLERQVVNGVTLYSLTADQEKRSLVLELDTCVGQADNCWLHRKPGLVAVSGGHHS